MQSPGPRFVFCINSGRSGSQYLAGLFAASPQALSFHESAPRMTGEMLRLVEREPYEQSYALRRHKARACRDLLAADPAKTHYVETNHMFIKTFFDVVMRELAAAEMPVLVVLLRRELARVVKSFVELGIYTERNVHWPDWMPSVEACTRAIEPAAPEVSLTHLERITAYLVDTEARAQRFLRDYPQAKVFETRLEAIGSDPGEIGRLLDWAGLTSTPAALAMAGQRVNERVQRKNAIGCSASYEECREAVANYLERCRQAGIRPPQTLTTAPWPETPAELQ